MVGHEKCQVVEIKQINCLAMRSAQKTRGEKMKVTSIMLLKTHGEKMPETGLSIMLLKDKQVIAIFPLC